MLVGAEYQLGENVIIAINDHPVEDMDDLITYLVEETSPGDEVTLEVIRPSGEQESIDVVLGVRPSTSGVTQENK